MLRARLLPALVVLASCFSAPPDLDPAGDAIDVCRGCEARECTSYYDACVANAECNACIDAPIDLVCLGVMAELFRGLAYCSCSACAEECSYMCPGPPDGCTDCRFMADCDVERTDCTNDPDCLVCLADPFATGCQQQSTAIDLDACVCRDCGPKCIWECDEAVGTCTTCLLGDCAMPFGACMGDDTCQACFANNANPGCDENMLLAQLGMCTCTMCPECGPLFPCM